MGISKTNKFFDPDWQKQGLCYREGYGLFFPDDKEDARKKTPAAKALCSTPCPVKAQCLKYALETDSQYGVWGGTTRGERKKIVAYLKDTGQSLDDWLEGVKSEQRG